MPASTYDRTYNLKRVMGVVDGTTGADQLARPGSRTYCVDYLSQSWQEMLNGIRFWQDEVWRGEKLTTLCWRYHGTDATDRIVLAFNGLGHDAELRPGMILRIPLKSEIDRYLVAKTDTSGVTGKKVTI